MSGGVHTPAKIYIVAKEFEIEIKAAKAITIKSTGDQPPVRRLLRRLRSR
jgi:hypothetical protein